MLYILLNYMYREGDRRYIKTLELFGTWLAICSYIFLFRTPSVALIFYLIFFMETL